MTTLESQREQFVHFRAAICANKSSKFSDVISDADIIFSRRKKKKPGKFFLAFSFSQTEKFKRRETTREETKEDVSRATIPRTRDIFN